jgi:uncharacterized protein YqeY
MFKTPNELRKVLMKAKVTDKFGAGILTMILAETLNIAKSDGNREANETDVTSAVKRISKMADQSLAQGVVGANKEVEYLKQFAPKVLSEDETRVIVEGIINKKMIPKENVGAIMKELKAYQGSIDMALASKILKEQ